MGLPLTKVRQMATDWTCPLTAYVFSILMAGGIYQ